MSLYRPILRTAWNTAISARRLWWFAIFAGLIIGSGIGTAYVQVVSTQPAEMAAATILRPATDLFGTIGPLVEQARATGIGAMVALAAFGFLVILVIGAVVVFTILSTNALLIAADAIAHGKGITNRLLQSAAAQFWPALGTLLILKVCTIVTLFMWARVLAVVALRTTVPATAGGIIAFILAFMLCAALAIITPLTLAEITLNRRNLIAAFREATALLRARWLILAEASGILTAASITGVVAWLLGSIVLAIPFALLIGIGAFAHVPSLATIAMIIGACILIAYLIFVTVVTTTFIATTWTLLWVRLTEPGEELESWIQQKIIGKR